MDAHQSVEIKQNYMENEEFLSRNCYGGGKRKGNDSDVEYDPGHAKKLQKKKRKRKYNRKTNPNRSKGESRSSKRIKAVQTANAKTNPINNPRRPRKKLHEYDEDSIHPPTLSQVHDSGCFPANAKAAACASQPPDPNRTMEFMNELIKEIRAKCIITFLSQKFCDSANSLDDESYLQSVRQTRDMLESVKLFLQYESLDEDFEKYDCETPFPYEDLKTKIEDQSPSQVRKQWLSEILKYEQYVEKVTEIRASNTRNKAESIAQVICE